MYIVKVDENNVVVSVNRTDDPAQFPSYMRLDDSYILSVSPVLPGQVYANETATFGAAPRNRWVTKLAFDNRFTTEEAVKLKAMQVFPARAAEETDADYMLRTQVPAQLQVLQSRLNMASYIDLNRADTIAGVQALEAMGLLAPGRAAEILNGPIDESEYHRDA